MQYDSRPRPIKTVGVILDIDADKIQRECLLEQAQRDSLTNLYNKTAVQKLVSQKINESRGDTLLSDIAGVLKSHFRADDLVGRIGGDEFLVYLPRIAGKKAAAEKIREQLIAFRKLRPMKNAPPISCSIGVAFFPQRGADYFEFYKCADLALYRTKAQGKNNFAFYNPNDSEIPCSLSVSAISGIDSKMENLSDAVGDKLVQYTFRILYNSIDINTAIEHLLEIVGRAYDVSRVYIFESSEDGRKCSNTFEWCNTGVPLEIDKLQNIDYEEDLGGYLQNFNQNSIFTVRIFMSCIQICMAFWPRRESALFCSAPLWKTVCSRVMWVLTNAG